MKKLIGFIPFLLFANIDKIDYKGLIHISPITANTIISIHKGDEFLSLIHISEPTRPY
jgi:outer membrane protein insertion porin family